MTKLDDIKSSFGRKLDEKTVQHKSRFEAEVANLREEILRQAKPASYVKIGQRLAKRDSQLCQQAHTALPIQPLFNMGSSTHLQDLDAAFLEAFDLGSFYSPEHLSYPTIYCESLEEFYNPIVERLNLSSKNRKSEQIRMIAEAQQIAEQGGTYGYNLPGQGCYLNGWLFAYEQDLPPRAALKNPKILHHALATAAHEKLGHGFLGVYSALGKTKTDLDLSLSDIAQRFGVRPSDNPVDGLRLEQHNLLFMVSQLLEEGWSTWVETYIGSTLLKDSQHPRHNLTSIIKAIETLPKEMSDREQLQSALSEALSIIFNPESLQLYALNQAIMTIQILGSMLDDHFSSTVGQPLRYAVGELIMTQVENNLGPVCAPYAALIAANINFNPQEISLSDLREMFDKRPTLNPDTRLAAISHLVLKEKNNVQELAQRVETELNFSVPAELRTNS